VSRRKTCDPALFECVVGAADIGELLGVVTPPGARRARSRSRGGSGIADDVLYVPLYLSKGLTLTAVLYVCFGCLCVTALRAWSRALPLASAVAAAGRPVEVVK
jgi:hypothetical protein